MNKITHLIILISLSCSGLVFAQERPFSGGPISQAQLAVDMHHYALDLSINPDEQTISGSVAMHFIYLEKVSKWEFDLLDSYQVEKVVNPQGESMVFNHEGGKLFIEALTDAKLGESYHVEVYYQGKMPEAPNAPWQGGFSIAKSPNGNHWIGLSCQNDGADIFMPCKDQPYDKPDSVRMRITVPAGYQAIGNGLLEKTEVIAGEEAYTWFTQYPINNYSINFTVGKFSNLKTSYTSVDNNEVAVHVYLLEEHADQLETLASMAIDNLQHHEQYFGEYPFAKEKFGLVHTPYLGMEHQTINAYGNAFKYTETQGKKYDWLLLHELGHEWWANKVTAADWADFWIHEGICSFSDALYLYTNFGWDEYWKKMSQTRNNIVNDKAIVLGREVNSVQAYHPGVYGKASFVLHMMWDMMGDDLFFGILYDLANNPESTYSNPVTTDDFIALVNRKSGNNYEKFLRFYLESTEMAEVQVAKGEDDSWSIWISNTDFSLPLEVVTSEGIQRVDISPQPTTIRSRTSPKIDPEGLYLRKITIR